MARITLDQWISEALTDPHKDGECTRLSCVHVLGGGGQEEVYSVTIGPNSGGLKANDLAEVFRHRAQSTVQDIPGSQLFYLFAFYHGRNEPQAKIPFRLNGEQQLAFGETEPPTVEGRTQQNMRMTEAGFQFFFRQISDMVSTQASQLNEERAHSRMLLAENRDAWDVVKNLVMAHASQQHEYRMAEIKARQGAEDRAAIMRLGPALINSLTGREVFPQATEDTALIESLIEHLKDEAEIVSLAQKLPPSVQGAFAMRAKRYLDEKHAAQSLAEKALEGRKDPTGVDNDDSQGSTTSAG